MQGSGSATRGAASPASLTDTGAMIEWIKYSSYGVPFALPAGDTDSDGDWDATDSGNITGTYDVRKDANLDGTTAAADVTHANSITGGYPTLGRGVLSSSAVANRKGYAGYEYDPTFEGAGKWLYQVASVNLRTLPKRFSSGRFFPPLGRRGVAPEAQRRARLTRPRSSGRSSSSPAR